MKRLFPKLLTVIFLITFINGHSQIFNKNRGIFDKSNGKMVQQIVQHNTIVDIPCKGAYASRLKESFKKYWTVNEVKFTDEGAKPEPQSAIFKPYIVNYLSSQGNETGANFPYFMYGQTDKDGFIGFDQMIAVFPITIYYEFNVLSDTNMYNATLLRLPYMVNTLNEMVNYLKTHGNDKGFTDTIEARGSRIAGKTMIIPADVIKEWNANPNMTALMSNNMNKGRKPMKERMWNILDESDISFAGKFKIMTNEEIMKLENSPEAGQYTIFLPAVDDKKYLEVYDLKTKELLYFEDIKMSVKIKSKDFERINKVAGLTK